MLTIGRKLAIINIIGVGIFIFWLGVLAIVGYYYVNQELERKFYIGFYHGCFVANSIALIPENEEQKLFIAQFCGSVTANARELKLYETAK